MITQEVIAKFDEILARGLCVGIGTPDGQMCIEAAITQALGLSFSDEPECVTPAVAAYKRQLNDSRRWKSPQSRAEGLRALGIAQMGSAGIVDGREFTRRLAEKTIRVLIPDLFRETLAQYPQCVEAADRCEREGTTEAAREARNAAAAYADAAAYAADAEKYLHLSASLALEVLRELGSPGCAWLEQEKEGA